MTILKRGNQSDIEVVQVTPDTYILNVKGEDCGTYTLPDLAVKAIALKKECKIPSKWLNELAYVALVHVMGKLTDSNV
jgi:hypothetical protein